MPAKSEDQKVVAHLIGGRIIKGYLKSTPDFGLQSGFGDLSPQGEHIPLYSIESGETFAVGVESLKALFFVKTFEGRTDYKEVKFFEAHPPLEGLWVQIRFLDDEVTEGILLNSIKFMIEPGFFLKPPDPMSNNEYVYVLKKSLRDFRVLGVKSSY